MTQYFMCLVLNLRKDKLILACRVPDVRSSLTPTCWYAYIRCSYIRCANVRSEARLVDTFSEKLEMLS